MTFFNAITCVDVLPARKRSLYGIAVQRAERHTLIKWDPVSKDRYPDQFRSKLTV
jgi:hypothetical protein